MDIRTRENLLAALHGEAFAYARYALFAKAAREGGEERIAELFDGLAAVELHEHFAELAGLAGLVGTTEANLQAAIADENEEVERTYPSFAQQARDAGDVAAVERFLELAEDEREHEKALETALERIEVPA
jgi:rubrerythrin